MDESAKLLHRTVPPRVGEAPHPVILLLHGRGSNELDLLALARDLDPRFFVVSARAPYAWQGGFRWYELEGPGLQEAATFSRCLELLRTFVEGLPSAYPVDPGRLYLLGFSQGSMMANALTLVAPQSVAGAVLLSGFQPALDTLEAAPDGLPAKPFFVAHGIHDPLLGIGMGRAVRDTLASLGADLTYREYVMGHQIIAPELDDLKTWLREQLERPG